MFSIRTGRNEDLDQGVIIIHRSLYAKKNLKITPAWILNKECIHIQVARLKHSAKFYHNDFSLKSEEGRLDVV